MSTEFLERLKASRPDIDWDAELAAARERRAQALAGTDPAVLASAMNEFAAAAYRALKPVLDWAARMPHDVHRWFFPKRRQRCWTCHPSRKPKPLAVNGDEYQRRRRARRRRKRR